MATLEDIPADEMVNPVHLLLIGPSKVGKTDYIADLILDGFTVLYVDNDNGLNTLYRRIKHDKAALARCHYVKTHNIWNFSTNFFAKAKFQWNETKDVLFSASSADDSDKILEIYPKKIPFGVIVVFDSWTSITLQLLSDAADKAGVSMEDFKEGGMDAYGNANRRANVVCSNIQAFPGHVIVQAHPDNYDRFEKPLGKQEGIKQSQMVLKEQILIPVSVSRPHGYGMAKYFNEVGWMRIDRIGNFKLDFRQSHDRIGGGSLMKEGDPKTELRFSKYVDVKQIDVEWIRTIPAAGLKAEAARIVEENRLRAEEARANRAKDITPPKTQAGVKPAGLLAGKGLLGNK